jgi:hypothetical protein
VACGIAALVLLLAKLPVGTGLLVIAGSYGPKLYSLILYKRLDKRGELEIRNDLPREEERQ